MSWEDGGGQQGQRTLWGTSARRHPQVPLLPQALRGLLSATGELEQKKDRTQGLAVGRSTLRAHRDPGTGHLMPERHRTAGPFSPWAGVPGCR